MTDNKFTDEEVIKALELCYDAQIRCHKCSYRKRLACMRCVQKDALDLINRQKAEIEKMRKVVNADLVITRRRSGKSAYANEIIRIKTDLIKAKAIKEFAERLTNRIMDKIEASYDAPDGEIYFITDVYEDIDNLEKEMTEEK